MAELMQGSPTEAKAFFKDKLAFTTGPVELERWMKTGEDIQVIDVREREDYRQGHIPGALNLPKAEWGTMEGLRKDKTNVIYCYSMVCHLAATACYRFASEGFPVMELEGGIDEWKEHGFPLEK
jgi:rhodanese-related sulfurtransferase